MGLSSLGQQLIFPALASQIRGLRPTGLAESEGRGGQLEPGSAKRRGERRNGRGGLQFQRQIWSAGRPGEVSERAGDGVGEDLRGLLARDGCCRERG